MPLIPACRRVADGRQPRPARAQCARSRLRIDAIDRTFGETGLGPIGQSVTGALEGALFAACIVAAMMRARRDLDRAV
ncbi:MAG: hypothetical protein ABIQ43_05845 [Sphingomonas sp.]